MAIGTSRKERIDSLAESSATETGVSLAASAWRRLRRNPVFLVGASIIGLFVLLALIAPLIAPHDPGVRMLADQVSRATNSIPPAQEGHPFGGDQHGRDLFSRVLLGSQQTLLVAVLATVIGLGGGLTLGTLAGAFGGWVDSLVMRIVDVMLSVPSLLLAVSIGALFSAQTQFTVILAVAIVQIPVFARLLRGTMLAQRESDHVLAARSLGVRQRSIVFRHMLPNALGPVIVQSTLVLAVAIIDAAALSFLGLGAADDSVPEWGQMLGNAQNVIDSHPHLAFWPAACIIVVALGFTLVGESLRDALDPKRRR
ncbi:MULTISPECIES: ABC transporter permease [Actinoalloteichus]|uniref:Peptide/nickel transport system permease protein n=1 Tax=Actinoalloteichus caeruleus DSM 43889 TaxID=1120930 RepID=A0ABT1JJS9_ACTCY|nr:ABC transporter permease [Actinoalloteichus caeruleus]MCP2332770.1 peptide/nickel transport system permease protein [Actinoalloteichus caeruleus DSM 43889]